MAIRAVFADNLRKIRRERGLSQEKLALKAGMARAYIGLLERKKSAATIDALEKLAKVLKVKPEDLIRN